ncbi:hypothetical protein PVIIG_06339 [Plasmodium vivax India VII]|uniref:Variable surface protein n=1 Tax=Plasmodium vivax India VII TaxID=1077284 RepID=A0A0J9S335_PLAVI|nr:hypothetical protein PVIIG_06339 [Plasmodium vivax India VII]
MKFKDYRSSYASFNRLLAKHEYKEELDDLNLGGNLVDNEVPPNINNEEDVTSTYKYLKKRRPINLFLYKKGYKDRYSKKKGLVKLDCYYEKKIFDKLDGIFLLAKNMKDDKKGFKKKMRKRYDLPIGLSVIYVFAVGIIMLLEECGVKCLYFITKELKPLFYVVYSILLCILPITIFLVLSYITIKIIKYERLKAGKGKMNLKEYCSFCKDLINNKIN